MAESRDLFAVLIAFIGKSWRRWVNLASGKCFIVIQASAKQRHVKNKMHLLSVGKSNLFATGLASPIMLKGCVNLKAYFLFNSCAKVRLSELSMTLSPN